MMNEAADIALAVQAWLARLEAPGAPGMVQAGLPDEPAGALAAFAAEALARGRSLTLIVPDDEPLPDLSNALDLGLRPLCLVLPGADYASRIALRATLSLLKSRLARTADDAEGPAWTAQRTRLDRHAELWQEALAWTARGDREPWPVGTARLFPVRIVPTMLARGFEDASDWVVLVQPARMPADFLQAWPGALRTMLLEGREIPAGFGALTITDTVSRLRAELELLTQELAELELELATAQQEIAEFTRRYAFLIGERLVELDRLHAEIAELRATEAPWDDTMRTTAERLNRKAEQSREEQGRFSRNADDMPAAGFKPGKDIKKLFRQLAQKIHPDRATDERDRAWRTQLMKEANRAYKSGDEAGLREILALWRDGPSRPAPDRTGKSSASAQLMSQLTNVRRRVRDIGDELNRLYGSRLYELFVAANMARRQGRDLLDEMVEQIDEQIAAARSELDSAEPAS
jgi:hypothetical protein